MEREGGLVCGPNQLWMQAVLTVSPSLAAESIAGFLHCLEMVHCDQGCSQSRDENQKALARGLWNSGPVSPVQAASSSLAAGYSSLLALWRLRLPHWLLGIYLASCTAYRWHAVFQIWRQIPEGSCQRPLDWILRSAGLVSPVQVASSFLDAGCIASCTAWRWCAVAEGVPGPQAILCISNVMITVYFSTSTINDHYYPYHKNGKVSWPSVQ